MQKTWAKNFSQNVLLRHIDLVFALSFGVLFLVSTLASSRPLEDPTPLLVAAVGISLATSVAVQVGGRWLQDRLKDDAYAKLVRKIDTDTVRAQRPFTVAAIAGAAAALWGGFLLLTRNEFSRGITVWLYAIEVTLFAYVILASLLAFLNLNRHQQRMQRVLYLKDEAEREARERERKRKQN